MRAKLMIAVLLLGGCGANTPEEVRSEGIDGVYTLNANVEDTAECMASAFENMHGSPANVKTIGKKVTITIWYQGAFVPPRTLWSVDLAENGKSTVATFYSLYDGPWPQRIVEHCNKKFAGTAK